MTLHLQYAILERCVQGSPDRQRLALTDARKRISYRLVYVTSPLTDALA